MNERPQQAQAPGPPPAPEPPEPSEESVAAPSRGTGRTLLIGIVVVVALVVAGVALTSGGSGPTAAGPTACATSPGQGGPVESGLTPEPEPDQLPAGVVCAFEDDTDVEVASLLGGDPLVINFWATWCAPCVAEMPEFQQLHEAGGEQFQLVGINTQDAPPRAREFVADLGITYPLLRDPVGEYYRANNSFGMPTTLFVTPEGDIRFRHTGPLTLEQMTDLLAEHLDVEVEVGA